MSHCPVCGKYVDPDARPRFQRIHVSADNHARILPFHWECEKVLVAAEKAGKALALLTR